MSTREIKPVETKDTRSRTGPGEATLNERAGEGRRGALRATGWASC